MKKEYVIPVVLIIALSIYLLLRNTDRTNYQLPEVPVISGKEVSRIEIRRPNSTVVLTKKDNGWQIDPQGYPANETEIKYIIDTIADLGITTLVSESKDYNRYNLGEDKKIVVRAWSGDTLSREFEVGKPASTYHHTFIKLPGDERVYHAKGNFSGRLGQKMENFRDKKVLSFDQSEITGIEINKDKQSAVWVLKEVPAPETDIKPDAKGSSPGKTEIFWEDKNGKAVDNSSVNRLLNAVSSLSCESFIEDSSKDDFTGPIYSIVLTGTREYKLSIFAKTDKDSKGYPAISSENDYPFIISDSKVENIMKGKSGGGK